MITFSTLRASMARAFFLCKILWPFTTVCSSKSHMPPLQWIFPLCAPHLTFSPCVPPSEFSTVLMVYGFLRSPQRKNPLYAPFARKNSSKSHSPAKTTNLRYLFLESHYGHNILQRKKALAIEALRVENVIMRTKLLK